MWLVIPPSSKREGALKEVRQLLSSAPAGKADARRRAAAFALDSPAEALVRCAEAVDASPGCVLARHNLAAVAWAVLRSLGDKLPASSASPDVLQSLRAARETLAAVPPPSEGRRLLHPPLLAERLALGIALIPDAQAAQHVAERTARHVVCWLSRLVVVVCLTRSNQVCVRPQRVLRAVRHGGGVA